MFGYSAQRRRSITSQIRRIAAVAAAAVSVVALAACQSGTAASGSSPSSGGSAADFKGKTITLIAPDSPGGSYDSYARLFAPYLGQELGATVNVENVAGAGTLQGTNQLAAASPNGLTIGMVNVGADTASKVENQPGQSFDLRTFSWLGQPAQIPNVLVTQPGSSVQSFSALLKSSSQVNVLDIRNGIGDMLNRVLYGAFGVPHKLDTGFEATSALKQGFLAKDGQTILEAMSTLYPLISGSEAKPLLVIGAVGLPSYQKAVSGVPTLQSELSHLPSSKATAVQEALALSNLSDDFAAPAGLPSGDLTALRQAFAKAAALPALQAQALKESLPLAWITGPALSGQVNSALSESSTIAPYVK
jgi:tripartite-type tricarboxylate transporter receptor subunit TctC